MFGIGWSELVVIAVVAIIVVGPKKLPRLMRAFGHYTGKLRRIAGEFQRQFEDTMREAEFDEVRKAIEGVRDSSHPYISSEAAATNVVERAAPKPRRTKRKAGKGSSPKNQTVPKCWRSAAP